MRIHVVGERQQQCGPCYATDARQEAQRKAHADAAEQEDQPMPIKNDQQGASCRMKHVHFHDRPSLEYFCWEVGATRSPPSRSARRQAPGSDAPPARGACRAAAPLQSQSHRILRLLTLPKSTPFDSTELYPRTLRCATPRAGTGSFRAQILMDHKHSRWATLAACCRAFPTTAMRRCKRGRIYAERRLATRCALR